MSITGVWSDLIGQERVVEILERAVRGFEVAATGTP